MKRISDLCNPEPNQLESEMSQIEVNNLSEGAFRLLPGSSSLRPTSSFHYARRVSENLSINNKASDIRSIHTPQATTQRPVLSRDSRDTALNDTVHQINKNDDIATSGLHRRNSISIIGNQCERCGRVFNRRADMLKHVRVVHDRVKNFECEICGKKFGRKDYLVVCMNALFSNTKQTATEAYWLTFSFL